MKESAVGVGRGVAQDVRRDSTPTGTVLRDHFRFVQDALVARSRIPETSGHPVHKGTPREVFVREFLGDHVARSLEIGSGEIINERSLSGVPRPQHDIILYRRDLPRIRYAFGVDAVLCESVVATIEIKSTLNKLELASAVRAAMATKALRECSPFRFTHGEWCPDRILCFILAYRGPKRLSTLHRWIEEIYADEGLSHPELPPDVRQRGYVASPAIDGIYLPEAGVLQYDTIRPTLFDDGARCENAGARWLAIAAPNDALLWLFLTLSQAGAAGGKYNFDASRYVRACGFDAFLL